jgi:mono/diheme cytochrome c family protein
VVIQAMLTLRLQRVDGAEALIRSTAASSSARGVRELGQMMLEPNRSGPQGQRPSLADSGAANTNLSVEDRRMLGRGESTYRELCYTCHGNDGEGAPMPGAADGMTQAPSLADSPRVTGHREYVIRTLLFGLTGPMNGQSYGAGVMVPMGSNTDEWIADVASYVRTSFGNLAPFVTPEDVARVRASTTRTTPYTLEELEAAVPSLVTDTAALVVTASDNAAAGANALDATPARWDTGGPQRPGMWFQVELPAVTSIEEVQFDAAPAGPSFGFGRGQLPAGPPVAYSIQVSTDGQTWSDPVATGAGSPNVVASFDPVRAKFVRITQTGTPTGNQANLAWAIQYVRIYEAGQ